MALSVEAKRMAGWRLGGFLSGPGVVSMARKRDFRSGAQVWKMEPSAMLGRRESVGAGLPLRSQVCWREMVPGGEVMPWEVVSVGPVTRSMASRTRIRGAFWALEPEMEWEGTRTWMERPEMTSRVRTQRQRAPREGVSWRMRISERRI